MPLQLVTPPAQEPVSLAEAKLHLRVDIGEDDALIEGLISAARQACETRTGLQIVTARWMLVLDRFADSDGADRADSCVIRLPKCPVQSVVSVQYLDMAASLQTIDPGDYMVEVASQPARLSPVFGKAWPACLPQIGAVVVTFDAGFGTPADVPEGIKSWIKLRVGSLYAHREEVALMTRGRIDPLPFVDGLLDPFKVATV